MYNIFDEEKIREKFRKYDFLDFFPEWSNNETSEIKKKRIFSFEKGKNKLKLKVREKKSREEKSFSWK